jgi:P27 family predicted phage terminase small subunit
VRGRRPVPTTLKLLRGNPSKTPINRDEPCAPAALPEPPDYLSRRALEEWTRLGALLKDSGLISNLDQIAFGCLCQLIGRLSEAEGLLAQHGLLVKGPNGYPMPSPYLTIVNSSSRQILRIAAEFGMTPSSRSRVQLDPPPADDEFEQYLSRRRAVKDSKH